MVDRKIVIKQSVADAIAEIAWYIESEGLLLAAEKFTDEAYDFIALLADGRRRFRDCRDPERNLIGYKCISFRKNTPLFLWNWMTK